MVSHAIVPFIETSTLFLLANLFLQYNIGASVDDVATYISQAQGNFVVAWEILECQGKYTFEEKNAACIVKHWDYIPMIHRAVLKKVGPLLKTKEGTRYKQKNKQSENE